MISSVSFQHTLCLFPSSLHREYPKILLHQLEKEWLGHCHENIGYLSSIDPSSLRIMDQECLENGMWKVVITFVGKCLFPNEGNQLLVNIVQVTSFGIFVKYGYLRCIIPNYVLEPFFIFRRQFSTLCYYQSVEANERNGMTLQMNDRVLIEIIKVRYHQRQFTCIARFISKCESMEFETSS